MAGISSKAAGKGLDCGCGNKKGYNGNEIQAKEFSDGSGLDVYDFNARTYDQQIGRFIQIDPLAEEAGQDALTPYHFSGNNPSTFNDPDGKCPWCIVPIVIGLLLAAEPANPPSSTTRPTQKDQERWDNAKNDRAISSITSVLPAKGPVTPSAILKQAVKNEVKSEIKEQTSKAADKVAATKGGKAPNEKGKSLEEAGGADKGADKERYIGQSGKPRIADKSDAQAVTEFKANDSYIQYFSTQIKDGIAHAYKTGREYILKLSRPDAITKPLREAREEGKLRIE